MQYICPLIVVADMRRAKEFYTSVLGARIKFDFGANITFHGDFALQTLESWAEFIERSPDSVVFGAKNGELYFEEEDIDALASRLAARGDIRYVHGLKEHPWGQRVLRFYDPDGHIIEVGENLRFVCKRFLAQGMSVAKICERTMLPPDFVENCRE